MWTGDRLLHLHTFAIYICHIICISILMKNKCKINLLCCSRKDVFDDACRNLYTFVPLLYFLYRYKFIELSDEILGRPGSGIVTSTAGLLTELIKLCWNVSISPLRVISCSIHFFLLNLISYLLECPSRNLAFP